MKKNKRQKITSWVWKILFKILIALFCFTIFQVMTLKYINPLFTPNIAWEWAECIFNQKHENCPDFTFKKLTNISPYLIQAVIAAEDQRFIYHNGFDYHEIKNAIKTLFTTGRLRGASTISMQTARSVFLLSSRSVFRKIAEVYYTVLIEFFWDKQRILEMYLNTVDWGTHITGAEAASQKYYSTSSQHLTDAQAAMMTAILPNPHIWSVRQPTEYLKNRQEQIMKDMSLINSLNL